MFTASRKLHASAAALLTVAGIAAATPAAASATVGPTRPTGLVCMTYNAAEGTGLARLGYDNQASTNQTFGLGDDNFADPSPLNRGQPEQFAPGNGSWDLAFQTGAAGFTWYLDGLPSPALSFAAADLPFDRPCPERGPSITAVTPVAVAPGSDAQTLTVFGQGLKGASVSVSGGGVDVAAPSSTTEQRVDATMTVASDAAPGARDVLVTDPDGNEVGCRGCLVLDPDAHGATGPKGDTGPQGPQGPAGKDAVSMVSHVTGTPVTFDHDGTVTAVADCPSDAKVISGGHEITGPTPSSLVSVITDEATSDREWTVTVHVDGRRAGRRLIASATCIA